MKIRSLFPKITSKTLITLCANNPAHNRDQNFDWSNALIDAAILSSLTFFSTLSGGSVAGLNMLSGIKVASIAALAQFFMFLALKRGIVRTREPLI